jgi:Ca2+ transporting ATPase
MSSATYFEKYSLMIGYRNISVFTAYMGIENEDNPAQTNSYLPITSAISNANLTNSEVHFPSNSLKTLCNFISWSRFSCQFVRKLMQLLLPASIVPAIIMLFSGIFFQMSPFGILQILWVCVILCGVSGLNLSWEKPQDSDMQDSSENFDKDSSLLTETVKKQIISQCIFQSFLILILLVCGHQFLAESYDKVDEIIGADWAAKYSNESKDKVASGLYRNLLLPINSYEKTFLTYGIYSRHLTIIFNTYALMQIFNYFNCRKIGLKQINII